MSRTYTIFFSWFWHGWKKLEVISLLSLFSSFQARPVLFIIVNACCRRNISWIMKNVMPRVVSHKYVCTCAGEFALIEHGESETVSTNKSKLFKKLPQVFEKPWTYFSCARHWNTKVFFRKHKYFKIPCARRI